MQMQDKAVSFSFALWYGTIVERSHLVQYIWCAGMVPYIWIGCGMVVVWYGTIVVCDVPAKPGMYLHYGPA